MSDDDEIVREHFARMKQARLDAWHTRVPPLYRDAVLDHLDPITHDALATWATTRATSNVVLTGPVGSGKTYAALAVARARWMGGETVEYRSSVALLNDLRPDRGVDVARFVEVDVLIVDDLGRAKASEWTVEQIWHVLDERGMYQRPTIATTNARATSLADVLDAAAYSRLMGDALVLRVVSRDRRNPLTEEDMP